MLNNILATKNLNMSNFYSLQYVFKYLTQDDYQNIINELNGFYSTLYTNENAKALGSIGLMENAYNKPSQYIHGIYHVEKVFFYCYIMVKMYNENAQEEKKITDEYAKILYYAALYHDVGRVDNSEDQQHGINSAKIFNNYFKSLPFFTEVPEGKKRLYLVEVLMNSHCLSDDYAIDISISDILYEHDEDYNDCSLVKGYGTEMIKLLSNFLKDADALDRERFGKWDRASLNSNLLRTDISKKLISFSSDLNRLYFDIMKNNFPEIDLSEIDGKECFHSIGFDFFKISSILRNGILSQDELKKRNITTPRNFPGGNFDRWISVVDARMYPEYANRSEYDDRRYASEVFTHKGITFYCQNTKAISPCRNRDRVKAFETGLPWNRSGYVDEKYVLNKISPENILGIFIPFEVLNYDVRSLEYVCPSSNMDIIRARVDYYLRYTGVSHNSDIYKKLCDIESEYEALIINELRKPHGEGNSDEYLARTRSLTDQINRIIGILIYKYYEERIEDFNNSIYQIVEYELISLGLFNSEKDSSIQTENEIFFPLKMNILTQNPSIK